MRTSNEVLLRSIAARIMAVLSGGNGADISASGAPPGSISISANKTRSRPISVGSCNGEGGGGSRSGELAAAVLELFFPFLEEEEDIWSVSRGGEPYSGRSTSRSAFRGL